ncbi:hypothetical protein LINPERHAP1_LOCUS26910 [Linum perenne]
MDSTISSTSTTLKELYGATLCGPIRYRLTSSTGSHSSRHCSPASRSTSAVVGLDPRRSCPTTRP